MAFPVMSVRNSLKNLAGVIGGLALLAGGAMALVYSATTLANLTGTIQALWAASLISFGFCLPLLAEALEHPWVGLEEVHCAVPLLPAGLAAHPAVEQRYFLNLALALPISSLMYRHKAARGRTVPQLRGAGLRRHGAGAASAAAVQTQAQALAGRGMYGIVFCLFSRRIVCAESGGVIEKIARLHFRRVVGAAHVRPATVPLLLVCRIHAGRACPALRRNSGPRFVSRSVGRCALWLTFQLCAGFFDDIPLDEMFFLPWMSW